jgi:hypothetical protein
MVGFRSRDRVGTDQLLSLRELQELLQLHVGQRCAEVRCERPANGFPAAAAVALGQQKMLRLTELVDRAPARIF